MTVTQAPQSIMSFVSPTNEPCEVCLESVMNYQGSLSKEGTRINCYGCYNNMILRKIDTKGVEDPLANLSMARLSDGTVKTYGEPEMDLSKIEFIKIIAKANMHTLTTITQFLEKNNLAVPEYNTMDMVNDYLILYKKEAEKCKSHYFVPLLPGVVALLAEI